MNSGFNIRNDSTSFTEGNLIETGRSERFRYYKTRRNGLLLFVKSPADEYVNDLVTNESLRKEYLLGLGLNHPGFARYYAFEDKHLYEDFIEGESLRKLLDNDDRRLYRKDFIDDFARQLLEALRYLHAQGIVHLDLKPENILLTTLGNQVKIIDLSCAESISNFSTPGFTAGYEAPEQHTGKVNVTTDLYQAGKIIGELAEASGKTKRWKKFTGRATANHPDNRFPTAEAAIKGLPPLVERRKNLWLWILLVLITGVIISVIIGGGTGKEKDTEAVFETAETEPVTVPEAGVIEEKAVDEPVLEVTETAVAPVKSEEIKKKISGLIDSKLDELYSEKVTPMYERMMSDPEYRKENRDEVFIEAYMEALGKLQQYGEELKKEYPGETDYIDERIRNTFERKTYMMTEKVLVRVNSE